MTNDASTMPICRSWNDRSVPEFPQGPLPRAEVVPRHLRKARRGPPGEPSCLPWLQAGDRARIRRTATRRRARIGLDDADDRERSLLESKKAKSPLVSQTSTTQRSPSRRARPRDHRSGRDRSRRRAGPSAGDGQRTRRAVIASRISWASERPEEAAIRPRDRFSSSGR